MSRTLSTAAVVRVVMRNELRNLLRDRRAFFTAIVLPALLYPVMFYGMDALGSAAEESLDDKEVEVAHELDELEPSLRDEVLAACREAPNVVLVEAEDELPWEIGELSDEAARERWGDVEHDLLIVGAAATAEHGPRVTLWGDDSETLSDAAADRVRAALNELNERFTHERIVVLTGADPAVPLRPEEVDVARAEDASGRALGRLLPFIAVLVLVSGGSFAALDAFAGERESGTLETLFVQPVPALPLATGKFLLVLATGCAALLGNATSFLVCLKLGLGQLPSAAGELALGANVGRIALGLFVFLPTAVFLTAVLCLISARARSFREGQHYVFPLVLLSMAPASLAMVDRVELNWLLALVPIGNAALAFRDTLSGNLALGPAALAFVVSAGLGALTVKRLAVVLDAERLLSTRGSEEERAARRMDANHALRWAFVAIALVYVLGGWMQAQDLVVGLTLTLGVLVPLLALGCGLGARKRAGTSLVAALRLGPPSVLHVAGALLLAPAMAALARAIFELQQKVLPVPTTLVISGIEDLGGPALFALLCLLPGVAEELFFRGAVLFGLARDLRPRRVVLWQALLFGAVHASLHRFVPTAVLGAVLAAIALRARCIWPAVVLHTAYNATVVFELNERWPLAFAGPGPWVVGAIGAGLLFATGRRASG